MHYPLPPHLAALADQIPPDTRAKLTDSELLARATTAERAQTRAHRLGIAPTQYAALVAGSQQMLNALPPHDLAHQVATLKAAAASAAPSLRAGYERRVADLVARNPQPSAEDRAIAEKLVAEHRQHHLREAKTSALYKALVSAAKRGIAEGRAAAAR